MRLAVLAGIAAFGISACGGEREFSADQFVDEANGHGAGLVLGEPLDSDADVEVYELRFDGAAQGGSPDVSLDAHGGGTLTVAKDANAASEEYRRCEAAVSFTCYRAANIALFFQGDLGSADLSRVASAIRALGDP